MAEHGFYKTPDMHPSLSTTPSNGQQFMLNKTNEIKDYLLLGLEKEN